ncbi:Acyl-CoA thioesterase FadM [Burkholderia sp. YR290]|nr:Acyl-CoA thioesterase FadM [Burkholderia sp. YR290]
MSDDDLQVTTRPSRRLVVQEDWIDLYGHVNAARYVELFDRVGYELLGKYGVGEAYTHAERKGIFTVELNTRYLSELVLGDEIELSVLLVSAGDKRLLSLFELRRVSDGRLSATMEQLSLHVSLVTRKAEPFPVQLRHSLQVSVAADSSMLQGYVPTLSLTRGRATTA